MELYFIRHGIAIDATDPGVSTDQERWLTDTGIKRMEKSAKGLTRLITSFDLVYTSTFVRAKQTAEILANAFPQPPKIKETKLLEPGANFVSIEKLASKVPLDARVAFVGHEPDFSECIAVLVTGLTGSSFEMKKGSVSRIDVFNLPQPGCGTLVWHLQPKILRLLAGKD